MARRLIATALTAMVVLAGVTACGSTDGDGNDDVADSGTLTEETFLDGLREGLEATKGAHMEMQMAGAGQEMALSADMDLRSLDQQDIDMTMSGDMGDMHLVLVDGVGYLSSPQLAGSKFLELDPDKDNGQLASVVDEMVAAADLEAQFAPWEAGMTGLEYVGQDEVDGVEAEEYRLTVDSAKALEAQGDSAQAGLPETLDYSIWLDDAHRMLRVQFEVGGVTADLEVSGHDDEVTVEPPSEAQIRRP